MVFKKILSFIGTWTLLTYGSQIVISTRTQEASYQCLKDDYNKLTARLRIRTNNDTIYQIVGHTAVESDPGDSTALASCTTIVSDDQEIYQVNVTIDLDTDEYSPSCGIHVIVPREEYKLRFRTQAIDGMRSESDVFYDFICDSKHSFLGSFQFRNIASRSDIEINLQPYTPGLSLSVVDYQLNTPLYGETDLGKDIYYQIGFQRCFKNKMEQNFDTCGNEFLVGFHTFNNHDNSELKLNIMNPSTVTINVYIDNMGSALTCSPVMIAPKSFGSCTIDSTYEVSSTSNKGIRLFSPNQCVFVQSQYFDPLRFYVHTIFPVDITGNAYMSMYDNKPTEIIVLSTSGTTVLTGDTAGTPAETVISSYETYLFSMASSVSSGGSDSFFIKSNNSNNFAVFSKRSTQSGYQVEQLSTESTVAGRLFVIPDLDSIDSTCVAHHDNAQINHNGTSSTFISRGESVTLSSTTSTVIRAISSTFTCRLFDTNGQTSLTLLPSVQWSNDYRFVVDKNKASYNVLLTIIAVEKDSLELKVGGNTIDLSSTTWNAVADSDRNLVGTDISLDLSGTTEGVLVTLYHHTTNFQAILKTTHVTSNQLTLTNIPGFNAAEINPQQACSVTLGSVGDLVDNDCDNSVDEDISPGMDVKAVNQGKTCYDKIKVLNCDASPFPTFDNLSRRIIADGCLSGSPDDPLRPTTNFALDPASSDDSFNIYKTGTTKLVGFDNYEGVYLRCDVKFCLVSDSSCDPSSCSSRQKREVVEMTDELVTIDDIVVTTPTKQDSCIEDSTFIPVITVLSVLAALSLITCIGIIVNLHITRSKHVSVSMEN